jgi:hypothetical protein
VIPTPIHIWNVNASRPMLGEAFVSTGLTWLKAKARQEGTLGLSDLDGKEVIRRIREWSPRLSRAVRRGTSGRHQSRLRH